MNKGERQVSDRLDGIDLSHLNRYALACRYIRSKHTVLDFGCGIGYGSYLMAKTGAKVLGVDIDQEAIHFANEFYKIPDLTFELIDEKFEGKEEFDRSIAFELIEHVDDPFPIIRKLSVATKQGGLIFLYTPNEEVQPFNPSLFPFHKRHFTGEELEDLILSSDLSIVAKMNQMSKANPRVFSGWGGGFNIAICKRL